MVEFAKAVVRSRDYRYRAETDRARSLLAAATTEIYSPSISRYR